MTIRKKTKEELLNQAEGFLEYAKENGKLDKKTRMEISKILGLNEDERRGFLERLSSKFGKELDISDKGEIEKTLKKKHINFEKIWEEYTKYLSIKSKEKYDREKVGKLFESYRTPFVEVSDAIIDAIMEDDSEDTMEKVKIFLSSNIYKEAYMEGKIKNLDFLVYFIKKIHDKDDLKFLLDNLSLDVLSDIRMHDSVHSAYFDIDILKNNILLLKNFGYNKKLTLENLLDRNMEKYVRIIMDSDVEGFRRDFDIEEENEELKNIFLKFKDLEKDDLLEYCMKCGQYYIDKILSKRPYIHYENNGGYTSKLVHMFGGDWYNNKLMHEYIGGWDFDFLAYLWTIYWTKNWKKNVDLAYEEGFIKDKKIVSYENRYGSDNDYIASLKMIDNEILDLLIKRGVNKEDFKKFLDVLYGMNYETLELLLEKYPNITIKELNLFGDVLHSREPENLNVIFQKYPEIKLEELILLENENTRILSSAKIENLNVIFEKYPEIKIEELILLENENTRILSSAKIENLNVIFEKYPEIKIEELTGLDDILRWDEKLFMEFSNLGTLVPSEKSLNILDLFNNYTKKHDEIFKNIENKEEIDDCNWIDIAGLYSAIEYFEDDKTISDEIKSRVRGIVQNEASKDFIYKKLDELLKKSLKDGEKLTDEEIALLAVLNKKGLFNMGQSESLAKFIYQINKLDKTYKFEGAFDEIRGGIMEFVESHRKDSNELMTSFFQISTSLLEKSPAIYRNLIKLLNKLDSKQQEMFCREIFPLYNVELFLGENEGKDRLLGKNVNNDVKGQLIPMHERVKDLLHKINDGENSDVNSLLGSESEQLTFNVKQLFKEKFGIKKIPLEFTKENIESVRWHSTYLSNMHEVDEEKTSVLGYFLALKLDGKRSDFREGKYFNPAEYMDDSKVGIINDYLSKRSGRKDITKLYDVDENDMRVLQESESSIIIGNTSGIVERLKTIEFNVASLLDDDVYTERQRIIKKYLQNYGEKYGTHKHLGQLLGKRFKVLSGNGSLNEGEKHDLVKFFEELGSDMNDKGKLLELQNEVKQVSAVVNFVNNIIDENLVKEIQEFENICKPSEECLGLLNKIGINLQDDEIVSSNAFLNFIDSGIEKAKKGNQLNEEEYKILHEYIIKVHKELDDLYGIKDRLATLYENLRTKIINKHFKDTQLKQRFEEMSPYFFTKADVEKENIVSLMTNNMDIIIKNIRQCLGCRDKGCNNDTDLSFGCNDRFLITTSHREGDTSFADELVTLLPRVPNEEGFTFVMDRIYGNNGSSDILLNNIYVILKKINKLSPELKKQLSIFVPEGANLKLNEDLIGKIKKQYDGISVTKQDITVTIEPQPITDSYHEFGGINGGCRGEGDATISGYLIKFE